MNTFCEDWDYLLTKWSEKTQNLGSKDLAKGWHHSVSLKEWRFVLFQNFKDRKTRKDIFSARGRYRHLNFRGWDICKGIYISVILQSQGEKKARKPYTLWEFSRVPIDNSPELFPYQCQVFLLRDNEPSRGNCQKSPCWLLRWLVLKSTGMFAERQTITQVSLPNKKFWSSLPSFLTHTYTHTHTQRNSSQAKIWNHSAWRILVLGKMVWVLCSYSATSYFTTWWFSSS